jgi:hypothetical protein
MRSHGMKSLCTLGGLLLCVTAAGCGGGAATGSSSNSTTGGFCEAYCAHTAPLKCEQANKCVFWCELGEAEYNRCPNLNAIFRACALKAPLSAFSCSSSGSESLNWSGGEACLNEGHAADQCAIQHKGKDIGAAGSSGK